MFCRQNMKSLVSKYKDTSSLMRCYYVLSSRNLIIHIYIQKARNAILVGRPTDSIVQGCIVCLLLRDQKFVTVLPIARLNQLNAVHIAVQNFIETHFNRTRMLNILQIGYNTKYRPFVTPCSCCLYRGYS